MNRDLRAFGVFSRYEIAPNCVTPKIMKTTQFNPRPPGSGMGGPGYRLGTPLDEHKHRIRVPPPEDHAAASAAVLIAFKNGLPRPPGHPTKGTCYCLASPLDKYKRRVPVLDQYELPELQL